MEFIEFIRTPKVDGVALCRPNLMPVEGTLCVTGHHLILSSRKDQREELWLLHKNVDSIEKKLSGGTGTLTLKCKDFQLVQLQIPSVEDCLNIASSVESLSNIDNFNLSYPFFFRPMFDIIEDGWQAFSPETEFARLQKYMSSEWRMSSINKNYEICPSYPGVLLVPKSVDDEIIIKAAQFRQHGRFPTFCYYHKSNATVMLRSGQPLTGPNAKRSKEDEKLMNSVLAIGRTRGYIVDTRSTTTAKLATAKGGGVEPEVHYSQWRRIHQSIERHGLIHESLIKLLEACQDVSTTVDKWLSKLDSSGWLSHIKDVLTCACVAAQCLDKEGATVLVHGTEGSDSTLQVTSLAQIILDPDCRTISGFEALVEREWLQAGHPFADRNSKSAYATTKSRTEAPVFLLFLDCVWQVWKQFPLSFEFNEDFLCMVFKHSYASQYGTFMCNNENERKRHQLAHKTVSLWSWLNRPEVITNYMNPLYDPNSAVLWPSVAPQSIILWSRLYMSWQKYMPTYEEIWIEVARIKERDKEQTSKCIKMRKYLVSLAKEAIDKGLMPVNNRQGNSDVASPSATHGSDGADAGLVAATAAMAIQK